MRVSFHISSSLALAATALGTPIEDVEQRTPTVYLAGDSTTAVDGGAIAGWGVFLPYSLSIPVVNRAVAGTSARSYTVNGHFDQLINLLQSNDVVIIEFGHNDGGSLSHGDNGRTDCPGTADETCQSTYNGQPVIIHTFPWYLIKAGAKMIAKGTKLIISSQTPDNPWEFGSFVYTDGGRFVGYAKQVAAALGSNAMYVDHGAYTANIWKLLDKTKTDQSFPLEHTHTGPAGAAIVAQAFVKGLQCGGAGFLQEHIKNATASIPGACL